MTRSPSEDLLGESMLLETHESYPANLTLAKYQAPIKRLLESLHIARFMRPT